MRTLLLVAAILTTSAIASSQPVPSWYTSRMTHAEGSVLIEHFWAKGALMRAQTVIGGHPLVTLIDEKRYVIYDGMTRTGISIERGAIAIRQDAGRGRPFAREADPIVAAGEKVESAVIAGRDADHYRVTDKRGRREAWVMRDDLQLPLEIRIRERKTGIQRTIRHLEWEVGLPFDDAFFRTPEDVTIEELGYDEYVERSTKGPVGPAPPFYANLLHGVREP